MKIKYKSREYLNELQKQLEVFIPSCIPMDMHLKKQREQIIHKSFLKKCKHNTNMNLYEFQLIGSKNINDIIVSQILGINNIIVNHFVSEYGALKTTLKLLNEEYKELYQFHEVKEFIPKYDLKKIKSCLYDDLAQLIEVYNIRDVDVKYLVTTI